MKILNTTQIRQADQYTIEHEPIASIALMERASEAFTTWFVEKWGVEKSVHFICGIGNNGGDGLAVARMLKAKGYQVSVEIVGNPEKCSQDFRTNYDRLASVGIEVKSFDNQIRNESDIIIDGLFGSGLTRPVGGQYAEAVKSINESQALVVSIDIPSGLFAEQAVGDSLVIKAEHVVSFQVPKLAFFLPENGKFIKNWEVVDIGLNESFINDVDTPFGAIDYGVVSGLLRKRPKFYHKGDAGRVLLVTGSEGKMGASVLCARACLRAGTGLLIVHIPKLGNAIVQSSVPEAMVALDSEPGLISSTQQAEDYDAIGIGPGLGTHEKTYKAVRKYLESAKAPLVLDADALNIISEHGELISLIPHNSILTPHPGEFRRLVGEWKDDYQRLEMQRDFSRTHHLIVVLKNAHSSISLPDGRVYFNMTGNPGMATAGSGDVLTGIITGILGQGYSEVEAAMLSVFLHGLAGDIASTSLSQESLIASDIIEFLPKAFEELHQFVND